MFAADDGRRRRGILRQLFGLLAVVTTELGRVSAQLEQKCFQPCKELINGEEAVPGTMCKYFYVCRDGKPTNKLACGQGRVFDEEIMACKDESLVEECIDETCPPTFMPTKSPTKRPSGEPSVGPTAIPSYAPTYYPTKSPIISPKMAFKILEKHRASIESQILVSYTPSGQAYPSTRYTYDMLMDALRIMAVQGCCRDDDLKFILYDEDEFLYMYGLVNLAAFLSNAMVEAIQFDTCDELNEQQVAGRYAISNSCGQHGRSYQDETQSCGLYACQVESTMEIVAVDTAMGVRSPPPFECREGSGPGKYSGYWDTQSGREIKATPYSNSLGRIDVESCCWWGRGALLTRNPCNIGKLDYFLGRRAGRRALYPDISFCLDPEATCSSQYTDEMRWTTAMFEWVDRVQLYGQGWNYEGELMQFVDDGAKEGDPFIDIVIRIFHGNCHREGCSDEPIRFADERRKNFYDIINNILQLGPLIKTFSSTPSPTGDPYVSTPVPTVDTTMHPTETSSRPTKQQIPVSPDVAALSTICKGMPRGIVTLNECMSYVECFDGVASEVKKCSEGSIFDVSINECNWEDEVVNCYDNGPVKLEPFQPSEEKISLEPTRKPTNRWQDFQTVGIGTREPNPTTLIILEGSGGSRVEDAIFVMVIPVILLTFAQY